MELIGYTIGYFLLGWVIGRFLYRAYSREFPTNKDSVYYFELRDEAKVWFVASVFVWPFVVVLFIIGVTVGTIVSIIDIAKRLIDKYLFSISLEGGKKRKD